MDFTDSHSRLLIENLPDAFAYHKIVEDSTGAGVDYVFIEVNTAFEEMTGLRRDEVISRRVTEVLPGIEDSGGDWIATYASVAASGEPQRFEMYSPPLGRWYAVTAYSDRTGYFATIFRDITDSRRKERNLEFLAESAKRSLARPMAELPYQSLADGLRELSGARLVTLTIQAREGVRLGTHALSCADDICHVAAEPDARELLAGICQDIAKSASARANEAVAARDRASDHGTVRGETANQEESLLRFESLRESVPDTLSHERVEELESCLGIGEVWAATISYKGAAFGSFILFMPRSSVWSGCGAVDAKAVRLYSDQAALTLRSKEAERDAVRLVDNSPDIIARFNTDFEHIYCNRACEVYFGVEKDYLIGKRFTDLNPDAPKRDRDAFERMTEALRQCLETKAEQKHELTHELNGEWRTLATRVVPEFADNGSVESLLSVTRDVTDYARVERQLRNTKERLDTLISHTPAVIYSYTVVDGQPRVDYVSKNVRRLLGYEAEDFTGSLEMFKACVHPDDYGGLSAAMKSLLSQGGETVIEYRVQDINGIYHWLRDEQRVLTRPDGTTEGFGSWWDITETRQVQEALRDSEQRLRSIIESAKSVALVVTDLNSSIEEFSPGAERIFGYTPDQMIGGSVAILHNPDEAARLSDYIEKLHRDGTGFTVETDLVRKNGELFPALFTLEPLFDGYGELAGTLGVSVDISELRQVQDALLAAKEQAEVASKAKSDFLASMSHEIRTPMNGVIGFTDLLLTTDLDTVQKQYLEHAHSSARSLLMLLNDILDFSKIEANRLQLEYAPLDLRDVLEKAMDIIAYRAHRKGLELILNIDPLLPQMVSSDEVRLHQILTNLLSNAAKFTEAGEVELKAVRADPAAPGTITFSVRDTGIGMTQEQKEKVFDSFMQADFSSTRRYEGTGLGLSISKSLVEKMGGELFVDTVPSEGSTFSFTLDMDVETAIPETPAPGSAVERVLIVDDNSHNREILQAMCAHWNIESWCASNGLETLEFLGTNTPVDAVLLDYHMPYMDGFDVADKIRNDLGLTREALPILFLSSSADDATVVDRCREFGIDFRIVKPVKMRELSIMLGNIRQATGSVRGASDAETDSGHDQHDRGSRDHAGCEVETEDGMPANAEAIRILIAEDNPSNMLLSVKMLERVFPNASILQAKDGEEAVALFESQRPQVVFMDVQMPGMDGHMAAAEIRRLEAERTDENSSRSHRTLIIALTAGALEGDREKAIEAGMDDYLAKPVTRDSLSGIVQQWKSYFSALPEAAQESGFGDSRLKSGEQEAARERVGDPIERAVTWLSSQGHGTDTIEQMVDLLVERIPELLETLRDSIAGDDMERTGTTAHSAKGLFNTIGLEEEAAHALAAEKAARGERHDEARQHGETVCRDLELLARWLKARSGREVRE